MVWSPLSRSHKLVPALASIAIASSLSCSPATLAALAMPLLLTQRRPLGARPSFGAVVRLTMTLAPMVLAPFELCPHGFLYILHRGVAVHRGVIVTKGSTWGEDIIVSDYAPYLVRGHNARAMNYVEVFVIDLQSLTEAATGFPRSHAHIRHCAVRLAMRREFIRIARRVQRENASRHGGEHQGKGSFRGLLHESTKASTAEVQLSQQLIDLRRGGTGSAKRLSHEGEPSVKLKDSMRASSSSGSEGVGAAGGAGNPTDSLSGASPPAAAAAAGAISRPAAAAAATDASPSASFGSMPRTCSWSHDQPAAGSEAASPPESKPAACSVLRKATEGTAAADKGKGSVCSLLPQYPVREAGGFNRGGSAKQVMLASPIPTPSATPANPRKPSFKLAGTKAKVFASHACANPLSGASERRTTGAGEGASAALDKLTAAVSTLASEQARQREVLEAMAEAIAKLSGSPSPALSGSKKAVSPKGTDGSGKQGGAGLGSWWSVSA